MSAGLQVLIADDRRSARLGMRALLSTRPEVEGTLEAISGGDAVRLVEEGRPDVVLMDVRMPGLDGLEATKIIKSSWSEVKVIVLSMSRSYETAARDAGADGFLLKGCPTEELIQAIVRPVLDDRPQQRATHELGHLTGPSAAELGKSTASS